jgi:transcription initiation factor TFIIH subunit 2
LLFDRLLKDTTPLQRGIIRHVILILDLSIAMLEKDLRPTRYLLTISYASNFVQEFFEQNPISQLGIIGMRDGLAVRISNMSGNPNDHISSLQELRKQEPRGQPSLENALEMARASLFHAPTHGTREVLLVFGALNTADPNDIHQTIVNLVKDKIRARVIGLAAQVAICAELVSKTNNGDRSNYHIVLNEQHFRELMMELTTPPVTSAQTKSSSSLLMMGFPSRIVEAHPTLCACHSRPSREGYLCSRCGSKVCSLPAECPSCGLTLILSTHLARSYHHLFPLVNWEEVHWRDAWRSSHCLACGKSFPGIPPPERWGDQGEGLSGRYECQVCRSQFCIDCDLFAHEVVHNCPGCQSGIRIGIADSTRADEGMRADRVAKRSGQKTGVEADNGNSQGAMLDAG